MEYLERALRASGDPRDLERASHIAIMRQARKEDIPFPSVAVPVENKTLTTPEKPQEFADTFLGILRGDLKLAINLEAIKKYVQKNFSLYKRIDKLERIFDSMFV